MDKNKVFIIWSGDLSFKAAEALRDWLPKVIQAVTPFISSEDIRKGDRWLPEISRQLEETNSGILCLTPGNLNSPWILFETGALSKNIEKSSICPLLLGLSSTNIKQPLSQFQGTLPNKKDIYKLVETINEQLGENRLEKNILEDSFNTRWPQLKSTLDEIIELVKKETTEKGTKTKRSTEDILDELLALTRSVANQQNDLKISKASESSHSANLRSLILKEVLRNNAEQSNSFPDTLLPRLEKVFPTVSLKDAAFEKMEPEEKDKLKSKKDNTLPGDQIPET